MFLNTFNKQRVIEVFKEIQKLEIKDLVYDAYDWKRITTAKYLSLYYSSHLHKISIEVFNPEFILFANPECVCKIVPYDVFIDLLKPNSDYHKLVN